MADKPESVGKEVLYEVVDKHIGVIRLNRPDKRNAVNNAVATGVDWLVKHTEADPEIRVVVLGSTSDKAFCAGADLSEISKGRGNTLSTPDGGFAGLITAKREKPWIAAVGAPAFAGGCEIVLSCDMVVASNTSSFGVPEVKRGIIAAAGGIFRLARRLPPAIALELVATGDGLPAERAYQLGLINRLTTNDKLMDEAIALAKIIGANAPLAVRESLKVTRQTFDHTEAELWDLSRKASALVFTSEDAKEGPVAFLEKRAPVWKGR